eukprot:749980-Hanusia_phi.AAC.1
MCDLLVDALRPLYLKRCKSRRHVAVRWNDSARGERARGSGESEEAAYKPSKDDLDYPAKFGNRSSD